MDGLDLIFKIAGIGVVVAILNQVLIKLGKDEQAMVINLAGLIIVLVMVVTQVAGFFDSIKGMFGL